tara:strand:- start:1131 stop:1640 length:510 start_codon:yes stop_codon:yes gene_type:complete
MKIGISACLLGQQVRYDGTGKCESSIISALKHNAELIPFCPEVEAGLGIPREPIQLQQLGSEIRVLQVSDTSIDLTEALRNCAAGQGWLAGIDGYIFKARSPSCGVGTAPLWNQKDEHIATIDGEFVRNIKARYVDLPMIDEEQWRQVKLQQKFLLAVQIYNARKLIVR